MTEDALELIAQENRIAVEQLLTRSDLDYPSFRKVVIATAAGGVNFPSNRLPDTIQIESPSESDPGDSLRELVGKSRQDKRPRSQEIYVRSKTTPEGKIDVPKSTVLIGRIRTGKPESETVTAPWTWNEKDTTVRKAMSVTVNTSPGTKYSPSETQLSSFLTDSQQGVMIVGHTESSRITMLVKTTAHKLVSPSVIQADIQRTYTQAREHAPYANPSLPLAESQATENRSALARVCHYNGVAIYENVRGGFQMVKQDTAQVAP